MNNVINLFKDIAPNDDGNGMPIKFNCDYCGESVERKCDASDHCCMFADAKYCSPKCWQNAWKNI